MPQDYMRSRASARERCGERLTASSHSKGFPRRTNRSPPCVKACARPVRMRAFGGKTLAVKRDSDTAGRWLGATLSPWRLPFGAPAAIELCGSRPCGYNSGTHPMILLLGDLRFGHYFDLTRELRFPRLPLRVETPPPRYGVFWLAPLRFPRPFGMGSRQASPV